MNKSRTLYVGKNIMVSLVCQVINLLLSFIARYFFVRTLGITYLGVNGLFTNILTILSFAELGIGNAIIFHLYRPIAEGNIERIKSLLKLYNNTYKIIFIIVLMAGLIIMPFLQFIVDINVDIKESIYLIYLLFLSNTAISYLFSYKKSLLLAYQKNYINLIIGQIIHIFQVICQILVLLFSRNFIAFILIQITGTFLENIVCSVVTNKLYPYVLDPCIALSKEERKEIFINVKDLSYYKFGSVILNGTDNIIISAMLDIESVGLVSNYVLLNNACSSFLGAIMNSFVASVGNFNVSSSSSDKYSIFRKMLYICFFIYGYASVGLLLLSNKLIPLWLGEEYLLDNVTQVALIAGFLVQGVHTVLMTFRTTLGYFKRGKYSPLISAIINIVLSILFCYFWGLPGIFIATPIARILSIGITDAHLIFSEEFKVKSFVYFLICVFYVLVIVASYFASFFAIKLVTFGGWGEFILDIFIVSFVYIIVFVLCTFWRKEFKGLVKYLNYIKNSLRGSKN